MKVIGFLLVFLFSCYAQNCTSLDSCVSCTNNNTCGWCSPTQQCLPGSQNGPSDDNTFCLGSAWQYGAGRCAKCESMTDCRQCLENQADCGWCASTTQCKPLSFFKNLGGCKPAASCACALYKSCDKCTQGANCQWCENDGACSDSSTNCQTTGPSFNKTSGCPCTIFGDCFSCSNAYSCQWCSNSQSCSSTSNATGCTVESSSCNSFCSSIGTTCASCNAINGCGWCGSSKSCVDVQSNTCGGFLDHSCPNCDNYKYCEPCLDDAKCQWCQSSGKCQIVSGGSVCNQLSSSCTDWCGYLKSCGDCNEAEGCGWCGVNGKCINVLSKTSQCPSFWVHSCDPVSPLRCSFDGGAFVGGMFLVIGLVVLGALAYIVYRWKTGRKILYTELR